MKIKLAILILFTGLIIFSCKKEDKQPVTSANTGGGGGGGSGNTYPVSNATQFSGIFTMGSYTSSYSSTMTPIASTGARAYFSSSPQPYQNSSTGIMVNKVFLNGDSLFYYTSSGMYFSQSTVSLASETWSVNGANSIPSFTIYNAGTNPSASNYTALPTTISKSVGFSVTINAVSGVTDAYLLVYDGTASINSSYVSTLTVGNNNVIVTPANLSALATTTAGNIFVVLSNKKAYTISGKDYQFIREAQYDKPLTITP